MKFLFLGAKYEKDPVTLEIQEGDTGGIYRGLQWKTHQYKQQIRRSSQPVKLTYRGAHYTH